MISNHQKDVVWSIAVPFIMLIVVILIALPVWSQDSYYTDKLFGKTFVFAPKEKEICVKFSTGASFSQMQAVTSDLRFSPKTEGLAKLRYGVFALPDDLPFSSAKEQLSGSSVVAGVMPVFTDQEGYDRYLDPEWFTVQFVERVSTKNAEVIISRWGSSIAIKQWTPGYYTVTVPSGMTVFEAVRTFMACPEVRFTEPAAYSFNDLAADTYLDQEWHLRNTGQETGYTVGNDINVFPAWNISFGDPDVIVVIIDTGIDQTHPDLAGNVLPRGNEDWDFGNDDKPQEPDDRDGHGTAVSGIAAAVMNDIGVRGVAPASRIMPLQVNLESGYNQNRADAINYAVSRRNDFKRMVINCSWILSSGDFTAVHAAIQTAVNDNIPVICAAGNSNTSPIYYPAKYSETIAVAAMAPCDELRKSPSTCDGEGWWGSSWGEDLDVAAPG